MKTYERELELGFEVSAAQMLKTIAREKLVITCQEVIYQVWLEEGVVGDYKFRTRIRKSVKNIDGLNAMPTQYEFTTKYSKSKEAAEKQDNMELNAKIAEEEYDKLLSIYKAAGKEETVKVRTCFHEPGWLVIYSVDTYPTEHNDRARIEIEFTNKEEMRRWKAPQWLKKLLNNKKDLAAAAKE